MTITIDGVRYNIRRDGSVSAPPDPHSAEPDHRQWWWKSHPFAREIRRRYRQRGHDRLVAKMCRELARGAALLLCLLLPVLASAQTAPLILGNAADIISTEIVLAHGRGREANPLMGQSRGQRIAVKAASTAVQLWIVRELSKRGHQKAAKIVGYTVGPFLGGVAIWNISR